MIIYKCKLCNKKIYYRTALYGSGICGSCSHIGKPGGMLGKKPTKETLEKISKALKGKKRKPFTKEWCEKISKANKIAMNRPEVKQKMSIAKKGKKRKPFTKNHKDKIGIANSGKNNGNYIHGKGHLPYTKEFTKSLKKSIIERDNYTCQECGMGQEEHLERYGKNIEVHHIDYCYFNCDKTNLITLCHKCNIEANKDRDYYYAFYTYKMEDNYVIKNH
jgi:hypothetical protein